mgnify:FL=1
MAYIGKQPVVGNFQVCDAISVVNGQAAYTLQVGGVNVAPESANHMLVSLNGILQKPGSSFTISGSTMTFASNLATGDVIDFVQILGNVLDLGVPSDDTVTAAKIADDAVSDEHLDVTAITGQTAETSAADADTIIIHDDSASALRKMTRSNFLSGVGGNNTPLFRAGGPGSQQSISNNTYTKVTFSDEVYDPSGVYDASSNYRFTPGTAGYYFISALVMYEDTRSQTDSRLLIYKNGSAIATFKGNHTDNDAVGDINYIDLADDDDYYEIYVRQNSGFSVNLTTGTTRCYFQAFKLIS